MTKDQIKCRNLSTELNAMNKSLRNEFGFVRKMKKLAKLNEIEHGDKMLSRRGNGPAGKQKISPLRDSMLRSSMYNTNNSLKKLNTSYSRYGSSMGHQDGDNM